MYNSWDMEHDRQNLFSFWTIFALLEPPPTPLKTQRTKFWKNEKTTWRYHHFTQVYNKWRSYNIWFLRYEVHQTEFFLSSWAIFCLFTHLAAWKMKVPRKWETHLGISSFYTSVPKIMIIGYTVPEIWHVTDVIVIFHFGLFFALLPT